MELIDAVLYALMLSGWLCGAYIAVVTGFIWFVGLGLAVSIGAFVWLGIKSIGQMDRKDILNFK